MNVTEVGVMLVQDGRGDYAVECDVCGARRSTPQPVVSAARRAADYAGWVEMGGLDVCPWCRDGRSTAGIRQMTMALEVV